MQAGNRISFRRRMLDALLAAWGAIVVFGFFAPYAGLPASLIDRTGLHVALLGLCLGAAAVDAALDALRIR